MAKETVFIAIGNHKGGVGKSTLTTMYASQRKYTNIDLWMNEINKIINMNYEQD